MVEVDAGKGAGVKGNGEGGRRMRHERRQAGWRDGRAHATVGAVAALAVVVAHATMHGGRFRSAVMWLGLLGVRRLMATRGGMIATGARQHGRGGEPLEGDRQQHQPKD